MNTYRNISSNPPACQELYLAKMPKFHLWSLLLSQTFEIILTLEGITPETGNTIQVDPFNQFFCQKKFPYKSNMDPILSNMDAASRFALPTCRMKSSGGLGEPEIFYFHFENTFVENISDLSTLVWPMIRRWPNMSWTRPTSMQPSLTAPQGETFHNFSYRFDL